MSESDETKATSDANRALGAAGQADMVWGHASIRDPQGQGFWMKSAGWSFTETTPDRVVLLAGSGEVLHGSGRAHIEHPIHGSIYRRRPDVNSAVHTHSRTAVAFASLETPLRALSHDGVMFSEPDVPRFTTTGDLIATAALGDALAECLGDAHGVLIPGHGLVTVGSSSAAAVMGAVLLDRACGVQLSAMQAGGPHRWSPPEEVRAKRQSVWSPAQLQAGYEYLLRANP